jgi:hypothetical protein
MGMELLVVSIPSVFRGDISNVDGTNIPQKKRSLIMLMALIYSPGPWLMVNALAPSTAFSLSSLSDRP